MRDLLFLALALGFFAVCIAYIHLCDRIIGADPVGESAAPHATVGEEVTP